MPAPDILPASAGPDSLGFRTGGGEAAPLARWTDPPTASPMDFFGSRLFARLLWFAPILMLVISVALVRAGVEQREVATVGTAVEADVTGLTLRERSEITRGEVQLRYLLPGASDSTTSTSEMPMVLLKEIEADLAEAGEAGLRIPIRVQEGSDQIILGRHARGQWVLTFAFAGMALIGAIGLVFLVGGWNRLLARDGDPGTRVPAGA